MLRLPFSAIPSLLSVHDEDQGMENLIGSSEGMTGSCYVWIYCGLSGWASCQEAPDIYNSSSVEAGG